MSAIDLAYEVLENFIEPTSWKYEKYIPKLVTSRAEIWTRYFKYQTCALILCSDNELIIVELVTFDFSECSLPIINKIIVFTSVTLLTAPLLAPFGSVLLTYHSNCDMMLECYKLVLPS